MKDQVQGTNNFVKDQLFRPEIFTDSTEHLSDYTRDFYGDWILELRQGKTFFLLHVNWAGYDYEIPDDYDRYVFSFHVEPWQHDWLKEFCESHPNQEVVVISEYPLRDGYYPLPNMRVLVHHYWGWIIPWVLEYDNNTYIPPSQRSMWISSLVNKPSFFKSLTTAYLFRHALKERAVMSWNINKRQERCPSMNFLDTSYNYPQKVLELVQYYHDQNLGQMSIKLDEFNDTRFSNYFCQIPAYTQCLVNITNETYQTTQVIDVTMSGPFITEKTWKPLLAGCAMLPQGMPHTYEYFENFGFRFDYPWDRSFDQVIPDFNRYTQLLATIDEILHFDFHDLGQAVAESNRHNFEHIRSRAFVDRINAINQQEFENFCQNK